ncbi:hypothetical protein [Streptomyces sp. CB02959]|uniref:hypothetical protein n=1 Tax=Streptomyces sp. CB02959 TaxID=2020330 RepID=UPI000C27FB96|nr:hypothetical protein [Streptomyces sp. CB02959]PJN34664.1 hypothetical protein CG747_39050 [Streptomyces sp. CB02959]
MTPPTATPVPLGAANSPVPTGATATLIPLGATGLTATGPAAGARPRTRRGARTPLTAGPVHP